MIYTIIFGDRIKKISENTCHTEFEMPGHFRLFFAQNIFKELGIRVYLQIKYNLQFLIDFNLNELMSSNCRLIEFQCTALYITEAAPKSGPYLSFDVKSS